MYQTDSLGLVSAPLIAFTTNNVVQNKLQLLLREVYGNYTDKLMQSMFCLIFKGSLLLA